MWGITCTGAPLVVAPPLFVDHRLVDGTGGHAVEARHGGGGGGVVGVGGGGGISKTLVVPQVQVSFGPVFGHKHFPMLKGAHGAGVYVNVGI